VRRQFAMSVLSLTAEAIPSLCNLVDPPAAGYSPVLQVLMVKKIKRHDGGLLYRLVLSDGIFYCDGALNSQLYHLVEEGVLDNFCYVQVKQCNAVEVDKTVVLVIIDLVVLQNVGVRWGTPTRFSPAIDSQERKRKSSEPLVIVRNHFYIRNTEDDSNEDNDSPTCDGCNGKPCDWIKYGPDIITFVEELCDVEELKLTNKNKRFLSYSGYSALKHGYLGRNNRLKVPHCVETGIQSNYTEDDGTYVGFRPARDP
jgi:hypothetical protein